ncbi:hypothetical protein B0T10DRAFT_418937, partial [Thelonectria olida]
EKPSRKTTGQNTFWFRDPVENTNANPLTVPFFAKLSLDCQHIFTTHDRRLVVYPCHRGKLLHIVAIHPSKDIGLESEWSKLAGGKLEVLFSRYSEFSPEIIEMCSLAEDVKQWSLATRDSPSSSTLEKKVLVGNAAHPMLPCQGQGGAQSLGDGAALGALFPADTTAEQVPRRLGLYNKLRYGRTVTIMVMSIDNSKKRGEIEEDLRKFVPDTKLPRDAFQYAGDSHIVRGAQPMLSREWDGRL